MTDLVRVPLAVAGEAPLGLVDGSGYLHLPNGWRMEWWIGGDDQWHVPAASSSIRQRSIEQTPIVETAMRVPGGDVVWRVAATAAAEGSSIVCELENQAAIPVAIGIALIAPDSDDASSRPAVHFAAPARNVAAELGIELLVHPVTHGSTWRCSVGPARPDSLAPISAIVSGWHTLMRQGAQLDFGDPTRNDTLAVARASLLLHAGRLTQRTRDADDKAAARRVSTGLTLLGHEDVAEDLRLAAKLRPRRRGLPVIAGALGDAPLRAESDAVTLLIDPTAAAHTVASLRSELVDDTERKVLTLVPHAPEPGRAIDVERLPTNYGPVSFALRWHGQKPALLWESPETKNLVLRVDAFDADWSTKEKAGEALLATP